MSTGTRQNKKFYFGGKANFAFRLSSGDLLCFGIIFAKFYPVLLGEGNSLISEMKCNLLILFSFIYPT